MEIKDYQGGDETAIMELFEIVFGKPMSAAYWDWRFRRNPVGKFMIKLMWNESQLVGHYAVCPVILDNAGSSALSGLSMTTMTHPAFSGMGIFQQLAENLYGDIATLHGVSAVWGFPNNNSHRGFIKNLGWKDIGILPMMSCPIAGMEGRPFDRCTPCAAFSDIHEAVHRSAFDHYPVKVRKSAAYLGWRYLDGPNPRYRVFEVDGGSGGFLVCKEYAPGQGSKLHIDIVDWAVPVDEKIAGAVLRHLAYIFGPERYEQINIWLPLRDKRYQHFEKAGFTPTVPLTYWGIRDLVAGAPKQESSWWIQMGDSDVY